jgi:hypothetical protein
MPDGGMLFPTDGSYSAVGYQYSADFIPRDMMTSWGDQGLRVEVHGGVPIDKTWLQDLASRLSLCTWPERQDVPATISMMDVPNGVGGVSIRPTSKLTDRWYALRLSALPSWMSKPLLRPTPDDDGVARFRVGSEPRVASVSFVGGSSQHLLEIRISEPVASQQSPATIVQVQSAGSVVVCSDVGFTAGAARYSTLLDCPVLTSFPDRIKIGSGLVSSSGLALAPVTFVRADLFEVSCGTDCWSGIVN